MSQSDISRVYEFIFRGLLSEESLDEVGRKNRRSIDLIDEELAKTLSLDLLDEEVVLSAKRMALVYAAIASFENTVRKLVAGVLAEAKGATWWDSVPKGIKESAEKRIEEEKKIKWHAQRGFDPINYTMLSNLLAIMRNNWVEFEPYIGNIEWAANIFDAIERSRNVIMHSGVLDKEDIERLGIYIRDWIKQVGG
jgi:hypothetical protein